MWASVVPPRVGGCRGRSGFTTSALPALQGDQGAGPRGQPAGCSQAELERVPWGELRGQVTCPAALEGEQRGPPCSSLGLLSLAPSLPFSSDAHLCL